MAEKYIRSNGRKSKKGTDREITTLRNKVRGKANRMRSMMEITYCTVENDIANFIRTGTNLMSCDVETYAKVSYYKVKN